MRTKLLLSALVIMSFVGITGALAQTCPSDIKAYWKFEEVNTTILSDYISVHDATSSSILTNVVDGRVGNAKYFDGAKSASVSNHSDFAFPLGGSFTIEFWIKVSAATGSTQVIVGKRDSNPSGAYWFVGINGTGHVTFEVQATDGVYKEIVSASTIANNQWRHIVAIRDENTNGNYLYVDGSMVASVVYNYTGSFISDGALTLGCLNNSSGIPSYFYKGNLDEVAIYNRVLTSIEISAHKSNGENGIGYCDGDAPSIISAPELKAVVNSLYSYMVRATGQQTNMQYTLLQKPTGMVIDGTSGQISWTPSSTSSDGYVSIRASNNVPPADTQSFRIFIAEAPDCPPGLGVLLKLDESSGPEYADFYGLHNATASVSPISTDGIVDVGQYFGSNTKLDIPDNAEEFDWNYTANWSIEFWMKTSNVANQVIVGRHRAAGDFPDKARWWVGVNSSGNATFSLTDNNATPKTFEISGEKYLFDNEWHHIIAVRQGSSQQNKLYVDGYQEAIVSTNYGNSFMADLPTPITVGYWDRANVGDDEYHFEGDLDEVAIFYSAINDQEAFNYFNYGEPVGHCSPGNFAPVFTTQPVTTATQDILYSYTIQVDDVDVGDPLTLLAVDKPDWLNFISIPGQKSGILTGTPENSDVSLPANVTISLTDGKVQVDQTFVIAIQNVNDAPVITSSPMVTVDEKVPYSYTLTVEDIDPNDVITMTAVSVPQWLTFSWTPGTRVATLTGTPLDENTGENDIEIMISDGTVQIPEAYTLNVTAINDPPVITGQTTITIDEDEPITLTVSHFMVDDPDNSIGELTLTVLAGNNYNVNGTKVTPDANYYGILTVPVIIRDPNADSEVFNATLTVNSVNDEPEFISVPDFDAVVNKLYVYSVEAIDADGDNLAYSEVSIPSWATFIKSNAILTGTPRSNDAGENLVILSVTDGTVSVEQDYILLVSFPQGVEDQMEQRVTIYPSPANDVLHLEFKLLTEATTAYIYNNSGTLIKTVNIPMSVDKHSIDISELSSGSYYCVLRNSKFNQTLKFLVAE